MRQIRKLGSLVLAAALLLGGCGLLPAEEELPAAPVRTGDGTAAYAFTAVQRGDVVQSVTVSCQYLPARTEDLSFSRGDAEIGGVYVRQGQTVQEGDLLAELAHEDLTAQQESLQRQQALTQMQRDHAAQAKALALAVQDARLAEAEAGLRRLEEESTRPTSPTAPSPTEDTEVTAPTEDLTAQKEELQALRRDAAQTRAALERQYDDQLESYDDTLYILNLRLEEVTQAIEEGRLYAGMDGTVSYVDRRSVTAAGMRYLTLTDPDTLSFVVTGSASAYFPVGTAATVTVRGKAMAVTSVLPEDVGLTESDGQTAYLKPLEPDLSLEKGDGGQITLILAERRNVLYVDSAAVREEDGRFWVDIEGQDGLKEAREVTVGLRTAQRTELTGGLKQGDRVILEK